MSSCPKFRTAESPDAADETDERTLSNPNPLSARELGELSAGRDKKKRRG